MSAAAESPPLIALTIGAVLLLGGMVLCVFSGQISRWLAHGNQGGPRGEATERHQRAAVLLFGLGSAFLGSLTLVNSLWGHRPSQLVFGGVLLAAGVLLILRRGQFARFLMETGQFWVVFTIYDERRYRDGALAAGVVLAFMGLLALAESL